MTTSTMQEKKLEKQIEKQMGCMAGFLQIFDRHHILSSKKFYTTKRLTSATVIDAASGSETSTAASPDISRELAKPVNKQGYSPSHTAEIRSDEMLPPPKSPLPLPIFNLKESSTTKSSTWKFKESPRLSLDSRATYDAAKGSLHRKEIRADRQILPSNPPRYAGESGDCDGEGDGDDHDNDKQRGRSSTSVIARLMGLEPVSQPDSEPVKPPELRRSASESRVTRDLFHYRFVEANNSHSKQTNQSHRNDVVPESSVRRSGKSDVGKSKGMNKGGLVNSMPSSSPSTWKSPQHGRSWFEAAEVFPEMPKQTASVYGEIEKRLKKMSGIDESASKDLETLKQILEAWQLKGLLHSRRQNSEQSNHPNFVFDRSFQFDESPIVVMKPARSQIHRIDEDSPSFTRGGARRNVNLPGNSTPPPRDRNMRSPTRSRSPSDGNARRSNSIVKPKPVSNVETQRRVNESTESRRAISSSAHSPRVNQRRIGSDPTVTNRSPRNKKPTAEIYHKEKITTVIAEDESSSVSGSSVSTSSQTDTERSKMVEYKEGRSLLERCDKLLHSIAEMNATDQQSSPVSVLDSSFYESASPSPIMKRNIDFKDNSGELEEEAWSREILSIADAPEDYELAYISEILRATHFLPEDSDIFSFLEKQQYLKGKDTSKVSRLQRKLIFDTISEILDRDKLLPPWKVFSWKDSTSIKPSLQKIWLEFQKIRERDNADELLDIICGVLKKDLAGDTINGWGECAVELSDTVLDIERMIFRDLVSETLRDLATFASQTTILVPPRRKLLF